MTDIPTIKLAIVPTDDPTLILATFDGLPCPTGITHDGHIHVNNLDHVMETACQAFTDAWEHASHE